MRYDPSDPDWPDRDRFVLSAGHASILLYSMLHLTGYGLTLDDLEAFRQWGSRTPGHPEVHHTDGRRGHDRPARPGLRQRRRHGASPSAALRARFGADAVRPPHLRHLRRRRPRGGHQPRGRLAGRPPRPRPARRTSTTTTTSPSTAPPSSRCQRRRRQAVRGLRLARRPHRRGRQRPRRPRGRPRAGPWRVEDQPSLIVLRSHIGYPSPKFTDTAQAHGNPLGDDEIARHQGDPRPPPDETVLGARRRARARTATPAPRGRADREAWEQRYVGWTGDRAALDACLAGRGLAGWEDEAADVGARREGRHPQRGQARASTPCSTSCPASIGGGADLTGNTGTELEGAGVHLRAEPRRPPDPLRRPRARHGRGHERHGAARRRPARRRHVLRVQRLHARRRCASPRFARRKSSTRGPTTRSASARTARPTSRSSTSPSLRAMPGLRVDPPGRRQRDRAGVARRRRAATAPPP